MTLIAFTTGRMSADIITDTLTYTEAAQVLGRTSKVHALPHLDAVVMTQGMGAFGEDWKRYQHFLIADNGVTTFDDLHDISVGALPLLWENLKDLPGRCDSVVFHVGYSEQTGGFRALAYASTEGFAGTDVTEQMVCMPQPLSAVTRPASVTQWKGLALQLRNERALAPIGLKVFVGGDVFHTRLERGSITHRRIHRFDETGDEFRLMVSGTLHPVAQLGPCGCGSGKMQAECHTYAADSVCVCGSGKQYAGCCKVTPEQMGMAART